MIPSSLLILSSLVQAGLCLFSVHDDLLAFPQYEIQFPDLFVTPSEASAILSQNAPGASSMANDDNLATYELMRLRDRSFLCAIPEVKPPPPMNATEKELSKVEEEKELARATSRGWELLSDLEGKCLYFVSGWWSYSFCHNREVRQFHQLPLQQNNQWPPAEDPETQSYVLGQVSPEATNNPMEGTELQATGELRYLVQKLGGGTVCDLTGKERKIEVQFHCNSHGTDRIDWIKEVSICCYLMVIYTPRLCNDVTFLPPRDNKANGITCREVLTEEQQEDFSRRKAKQEQADALRLLEKAAQQILEPEEIPKGHEKQAAVDNDDTEEAEQTHEEKVQQLLDMLEL
ncbi:glucosidase II beta subunit-like protein-domain-containing protein [Sphaerosporella brunnea]|uniref:Endoplasmic reticulum lectin n=1 Tax=Sphaerosporella brunnea TaxID=1250544 RepID=A0A5J5EL26_9PEZI|nr:glucosidase II beta subunit-like protein-domain-containing protein [Sphaerosporella brunnea]